MNGVHVRPVNNSAFLPPQCHLVARVVGVTPWGSTIVQGCQVGGYHLLPLHMASLTLKMETSANSPLLADQWAGSNSRRTSDARGSQSGTLAPSTGRAIAKWFWVSFSVNGPVSASIRPLVSSSEPPLKMCEIDFFFSGHLCFFRSFDPPPPTNYEVWGCKQHQKIVWLCHLYPVGLQIGGEYNRPADTGLFFLFPGVGTRVLCRKMRC